LAFTSNDLNGLTLYQTKGAIYSVANDFSGTHTLVKDLPAISTCFFDNITVEKDNMGVENFHHK